MKTLILFYSRSGNTRALARKKAAELSALSEEVAEVKKSLLVPGLFKAMARKAVPIKPLASRLEDFDGIILLFPIWGGCPAPAIYSVIDALPPGKDVEVVAVSANSGSAKSAGATKARITARGCRVTAYTDVKVVQGDGDISVKVLN